MSGRPETAHNETKLSSTLRTITEEQNENEIFKLKDKIFEFIVFVLFILISS